MLVVLLNWKTGDNDAFTYFNQTIAGYLEACGKPTVTIQLTDKDWDKQILALKENGIDFVFTWQGLGTRLKVNNPTQSFWEFHKIPIISLHGDHPCHMPPNHSLESRYCTHLYGTREFCQYSNRHFRRKTRAIFIDAPPLSQETPLPGRSGNHFVIMKNITPPSVLEDQWKCELDMRTFGFYMAITEIMRQQLYVGEHPDIHSLVDELIRIQGFVELLLPDNSARYHEMHSDLETWARNAKTVRVINLLKDVPLEIYGEGWESFAAMGRSNHRYFPGRRLEESGPLYYSRYGVIDITPSRTGLHDRTSRAMRNETSFFTSGYLPDFVPNMKKFDSLFYDFGPNGIREKCESIMSNPGHHNELSREFGFLYQTIASPSQFVWRLDSLARSMDLG